MNTGKSKLSILFIAKADNFYANAAAEFVRQHFENPLIVFSSRKDPFPESLFNWKGDLLLSYLAQWIIPGRVLENASLAAINLHPGPPEYPGIGCTNFAVYNNEKVFGITCHHMLPRVDSGELVAVRRFPVLGSDSVYSITQRCYAEILYLFYELMTGILQGKPLPASTEHWTRKPYKRKDLDELCELRDDMPEEEIQRRIKATTYGKEIWAHRVTEHSNA